MNKRYALARGGGHSAHCAAPLAAAKFTQSYAHHAPGARPRPRVKKLTVGQLSSRYTMKLAIFFAIIVAAAAEGDAAPREDIPYDFTLQIANGGIPHGAGVYWVSALLPLAAHSCPPAQRRLVT